MKSILTLLQKVVDVPAYSALAPVYDRLMNHVDYAAWAEYVHTLLQRFGKNIQHVVDGGCGTGSLAYHLTQKGYQVAGFDRSIEMVHLARKRLCLPFWQCDFTAVSLSKKWDAFLCIYDSIQYLLPEKANQLFHEVRKTLRPKGLFVFDVVTESHVSKHWVDFYERDQWKEWIIKRRSWYEKKNHVQHTELEISSLRSNKTYREHHAQYVLPLTGWEEMIARNGFIILGKFRDYTMQTGDEDSDRVHFLVRQETE
jgi:SAM-dependent methyltransferase